MKRKKELQIIRVHKVNWKKVLEVFEVLTVLEVKNFS